MPKRRAAVLLAGLAGAGILLAGTAAAPAQERTPSLPAAPQPTARLPQGPPGGSSNYVVGAAANEHGSFLWVVDGIQHVVILCEKSDGKEIACTKKPLP